MGWQESFDDFLDWTVFLSYNRIGYELRRRVLWSEADLAVRMEGKVCLVTGANAGLGYATTRGLAARGATVYMLCRDREKGEAARQAIIAETGNPATRLEVVDVSSLNSVRAFVDRFLSAESRLEVLINNAGVLLPERRLSAEGIEMTLATNVLGGFLLTNALLPLLRRCAPSRVINVSSGGMYTRRMDVDDLQFEREPFNGAVAYAQTKRAQVILSEIWAEQLAGSGVTVNCMHPGWADTPGLQTSLSVFRNLLQLTLRDSAQGADTILWLAVSPNAASESGKFWFDRRPRPTHRTDSTRETAAERQKLWEACERLSGWKLAVDD